MVKAIIDIGQHTNQILNIVKAKYGLRDKSEAIEAVVKLFEEELLDIQLRPGYMSNIGQARREKGA
jgi:hypothetical protein